MPENYGSDRIGIAQEAQEISRLRGRGLIAEPPAYGKETMPYASGGNDARGNLATREGVSVIGLAERLHERLRGCREAMLQLEKTLDPVLEHNGASPGDKVSPIPATKVPLGDVLLMCIEHARAMEQELTTLTQRVAL